jgi:hypothetical protein
MSGRYFGDSAAVDLKEMFRAICSAAVYAYNRRHLLLNTQIPARIESSRGESEGSGSYVSGKIYR